jgi:hypothetical protein
MKQTFFFYNAKRKGKKKSETEKQETLETTL